MRQKPAAPSAPMIIHQPALTSVSSTSHPHHRHKLTSLLLFVLHSLLTRVTTYRDQHKSRLFSFDTHSCICRSLSQESSARNLSRTPFRNQHNPTANCTPFRLSIWLNNSTWLACHSMILSTLRPTATRPTVALLMALVARTRTFLLICVTQVPALESLP